MYLYIYSGLKNTHTHASHGANMSESQDDSDNLHADSTNNTGLAVARRAVQKICGSFVPCSHLGNRLIWIAGLIN